MLSMLREATKGWTAKILLVLLVASFAVWGVSGSILQGAGNAVITVGETTVSSLEYRLAHDRQLAEYQRQLGSRITREQAEAFGLSGNVLTQLVSGALLDETGREMGLGMSDDKLAAAIGDDPAFRDATGRFSRAQLQAVLRSIGMREADYVETRRNVALRNQLIEATSGEMTLPDAYWDIVSAYQAEERKFDFVVVGENDIRAIAQPTDGELSEYYEANKAKYVAPEFRKLTIVKLEAEDIADPAAVSTEDVAEEYEARKAEFSEAEKRTIEQLVFIDAEKAQAAADALAGGKSFEDVVADAGRSIGDISLGTLTKADIPDASIAEAAFGLDMNTPSELVDGAFGKVLLRVTGIQPGTTRSMDEVKDEIRDRLALVRATDEIYDSHDRLEDERAAGETLSDAAKAVGLTARVIEAMDRTARDADGNIISDIPQSRDLIAQAFETDEGIETDPISLGNEGFVWYEVVGVTPERQKPLDEVKDQLREDWLAAERSKAVNELAENIRKRITAGEDFNQVIGELLVPAPQENSGDGESADQASSQPRVMQQSIPLKRNGSTPQLPQAAVTAGFGIAKGDALVTDGVNEDAKVVLKVAEVQAGEAQPLTEDQKQTINESSSEDIVNQLVTRLQEGRKVEINQRAINAAFAPYGQ